MAGPAIVSLSWQATAGRAAAIGARSGRLRSGQRFRLHGEAFCRGLRGQLIVSGAA